MNVVKAIGREQLTIAGLWTEICLAEPVIQALGEGWEVTMITHLSGAVSTESNHIAIQRMTAFGANIAIWLASAAESQRDGPWLETAGGMTEVLKHHPACSGIAHLSRQQLLNSPRAGRRRLTLWRCYGVRRHVAVPSGAVGSGRRLAGGSCFRTPALNPPAPRRLRGLRAAG